jgi:hypothetical protein
MALRGLSLQGVTFINLGTDDRLSREAVPDGIAAGTLFAFFRDWPRAFASIAPVGLNLSEGSLWVPVAIIRFVLLSGPDLVIGRSRLAFSDQRRRRSANSLFYCPFGRHLSAADASPAKAHGQ